MSAVWVVDDDQSIRWVLERALAREGFSVRAFADAAEALDAIEHDTPQVVVSDIRMPGQSGVELLQALKARHPGLPVIIMTAYSDLDSAVGAFQSGAFEYLPKPFDLTDAVELIRRAMLESEREASVERAERPADEMLGQAPAMQEVFRAIGRLSQSNATVLITGESGSGKELVARALHRHGPRAAKPFVALNTAAIPRDLLESELFGHERGAFTGAQQMRRGRFEQCEGGTLFLDEIGDMPAELQTRLLRVLSDGQFYRVGGHQPLKADVRVIAATHQNLEQRVRQGLFREDLFHRLNVIRLRLPPLRERTEDIPLLARQFLQTSARELGVEPKRLADATVQALTRFDWPGNVRQLENVCHWLTVMAPAQTIEPKDLPPEVREAPDGPASRAVPGAAPIGAAPDGAAPVGAAMQVGGPVPSGAAAFGPSGTDAVAWAQAPTGLAGQDAPETVPTTPGMPSPGFGGREPVGRSDAFGATPHGLPAAGLAVPDPEAPGLSAAGSAPSGLGAGTAAFQPWMATPAGTVTAGMLTPPAAAAGVLRGPGVAVPGSGALSPGLEAVLPGGSAAAHPAAAPSDWMRLLERDVASMLAAQVADSASPGELMDRLSREFESVVIRTALRHTRGRRIEAAQRLGIGRNTITRKIQELHLDDV